MNTKKLTEVLKKHAAWLRGEDDGERADLSWSNLRGANLSWADLRDANLRGANLSWADLRGATLSWATLRGADLRWADLRGADLRGAQMSEADLRGADLRGAKGILLLPVQDMRGYSFAHAIQRLDGEWRIRVGYRDFSIDEARVHWGSPDYPDRQRGDDYLYAVEWLVRRKEL